MADSNAAEIKHAGMGTEMAHKIYGKHAAEALTAVKNEAQRLERLLSRFLPESDISRINCSAGVKCEKISPEAYKALSFAAEISAVSQGLFDITIGPLADLWDYKNATDPPTDNQIKSLLPLVNYNELVLDPIEKRARLIYSGQSADLGGIGKGFATDRFMEIFREYGAASAFSNLGGNVSTLGSKPDGSPWLVGIRHPRKNSLLGAVAVNGNAVVTSGDYEKYFFDAEGKRRHHLLNPTTGYPAESGLISVTIVTGSAMVADALSTAIFVSGLEKGVAILKRYPQAEGIFVDADLRIYVSMGLRKCFQAPIEMKVNFI